MKKVFNLRIECNSPTFVMTDKEFCQGLEEVVSDEFDEEMKYVKLKAEPCDKDEQLAIYKRALELACETVVSQEIDGDDYFDVVEYWKMNNDKYADEVGVEGGSVMDYFLDQAKKELEEE